MNWYDNLNRPPLTPPGWVFGPVWTILYVMIALSIILYVRSSLQQRPYRMYALIALHLIANFAWSGIFFGLQSPGWALVNILVIDLTLVLMVWGFWNVSRLSSILLWPYLAWVLFATYLNAGIYLLNRG